MNKIKGYKNNLTIIFAVFIIVTLIGLLILFVNDPDDKYSLYISIILFVALILEKIGKGFNEKT